MIELDRRGLYLDLRFAFGLLTWGGFWVRLAPHGAGIHVASYKSHPPLFSERSGLVPTFRLFGWRAKLLKKGNPLG